MSSFDRTAEASDAERKLAATRTNEGIKLTATLLNNLAVGIFVGGVVAPTAAGAI